MIQQQVSFESLFDTLPPARLITEEPVARDIPYTHTACIKCGRLFNIPINAIARLCGGCRRDPEDALRHMQNMIDIENRKLEEAAQVFGSVLMQASTQDQARYEHVLVTRLRCIGTDQEGALKNKEQQARDRGDGLSLILRAEQKREKIASKITLALAVSYGMLDEIRAFIDDQTRSWVQ